MEKKDKYLEKGFAKLAEREYFAEEWLKKPSHTWDKNDLELFKRYLVNAFPDTYDGIKWEEFLRIAYNYGFRLDNQFDLIRGYTIDEEVILFHDEKGIILHATSTGGINTIDTAEIFGEVRRQYSRAFPVFRHIPHYENYPTKNNSWLINLNVNGRLIEHLDNLSRNYMFCQEWSVINPRFNLMDKLSEDTKQSLGIEKAKTKTYTK